MPDFRLGHNRLTRTSDESVLGIKSIPLFNVNQKIMENLNVQELSVNECFAIRGGQVNEDSVAYKIGETVGNFFGYVAVAVPEFIKLVI